MVTEITNQTITEYLSVITKTANLAENFDLALILGIVANARKNGKETELATVVLEYGIENNLAGRL